MISEHVGNSIMASDTGYDQVVDRFDISEADEGFVTIVAEVQAVRWQELVDICDFPEDTTEVPSEVLDAFMKSLARTYGADGCDIEEEDVLDGEPFDAYLTFAWTLDVGIDVPLDDAMEKVMGKVAQPAGPFGMHNALNGGFQARNFYADAAAAFSKASDEVEVEWVVTYTSMMITASSADEAIARAEGKGGGNWEAHRIPQVASPPVRIGLLLGDDDREAVGLDEALELSNYHYNENTGMEYTFHPRAGILESCHDGVGLVTYHRATAAHWAKILEEN